MGAVNSFHGFTVQHKIGAGGMSTVYMGNHGTLGYPVAVKVLHPGLSGDQSFISRFEREARSASSLNHNNIVNVIDFGSENDVYFIIMQYIDGDDLGKIFNDVVTGRDGSQFPLEITLPMLEEVAYGLKAAHQQGIIHRDIKPSNVMFSSSGDVKLADFGLARDVSDVGSLSALDLTIPGTVVGTPSYMSPEQAIGGKVDARTDIFSLGVMAYQLIVGEKPFVGATPLDVQEQIINASLPTLSEDNCPRFTVEIGKLLTKMLAKDPANRFQDMDQVLRALVEAQESIDPSGGIMKYKREYLARFAAAPVVFAEELRNVAINGYLKRGFYYKNMGLSNINDAIREFGFVLALDSGHTKAQSALKELEKQAEESGVSLAAKPSTAEPAVDISDPGVTRILPAVDIPTPPPPPPVQQESGGHFTSQKTLTIPGPVVPESTITQVPSAKRTVNRPLILGGLAAILVVAAGFFVLQRGKDEPRYDVIRDPVVSEPKTETPATQVADVLEDRTDLSVLTAAAETARNEMVGTKGVTSWQQLETFPVAKAAFELARITENRAAADMNTERFAEAKNGFVEAEGLYRVAAGKLATAQEDARKAALANQAQAVTGSRNAAVSARSSMQAAKTGADKAGSKTSAPTLYKRARDKERAAEAKFSKGGVAEFKDATRLFGEAATSFDKARKEAQATARNTALTQARDGADSARAKMENAKESLASYVLNLRKASPAYAQALDSEDDGFQAFSAGDIAAATAKFNEAAVFYGQAEPEIATLQSRQDLQAAEADIKRLVDKYYASVKSGDFGGVNSFLELSGDQAEIWRDLLKNLESLEGESPRIQLQDTRTATVDFRAKYNYIAAGVRDFVQFDHTWDMRLTDGKWTIVGVHQK